MDAHKALRNLVIDGTTIAAGTVIDDFKAVSPHCTESWINEAIYHGHVAVSTREGKVTPEPPSKAKAKPSGSSDAKATDGARKLATEHGVDLASLTGSGSGGRITAGDVQAEIDGEGGGE